MRPLFLIIFCEGLFVFAFFLTQIHCTCIHDSLPPFNISAIDSQLRQRRDNSERGVLEPLAIQTHMEDIALTISNNVFFNFKLALKKAVDFLSMTLKVQKGTNPFRLERLNCKRRWTEGENVNKCSSIKSGPEVCSLQSTDYIIPDRYLNKLEIFDKNGSLPVNVIQEGIGAQNSNFILFVISRKTSLCAQSDVKAYGSYCRLGSKNRPVAGVINMCPEYFSNKQYKFQYYYNIIMHEIFHILGFSRHLYSKFSGCSSKGFDCEVPKKISKTDSNGIQRLVFPELAQMAKNHYNCSSDDFGAPLAPNNSANETSTSEELSSHWHPLLMYSSIMTPTISEDDFITIDNFTLGLLASTGWYKVNFNQAEDFIMGKGEGCDFGFKSECENSTNLCLPSKEVMGCDMWQYTPGKCQQVVPYHPCGVIKSIPSDNCSSEVGKVFSLYPESLQHQLRCVMMQQNDTEEKPTCVAMKCLNKNHLRILIDSYNWVRCENEDKVYHNDTIITCPKDRSFCNNAKTIVRPSCLEPDYYKINIRMFFETPKFEDISKTSNYKDFKVQTINAIVKEIGIHTNYIYNTSLNVFKDIHLDFTICVPTDIPDENITRALLRIQTFMKKKSFSYIYRGAVEFPVLSTEIRIREQSFTPGDYAGIQALFIVPAVFVIFVLASLLAIVFEYCSKRKHRPQREMVELQDPEENDSLQEILKRENKEQL